MGATKDLRRRQRALAIKERRVRAEGGPRSPEAIREYGKVAYADGYATGRREGEQAVADECLTKAKEFKTVASIRRSLGAIQRRVR